MPTQLAVDLSRLRVRAVEIDGTTKSPRVKSFTAADVPPATAPVEGAPARISYADAVQGLTAKRRLARDPASVAVATLDCTIREIELPFTTPDQIDRVVKFEAESHLQLVDIDSVVVSYQLLDRDGRGGSRLLIAACPKETISGAVSDLGRIGVDPQCADLHLTSLYGALRATGHFSPPPPPEADAPPAERQVGETVLALECDPDLTQLLVVRGEELIAARALRFGTTPAAPQLAAGEADGPKPPAAEGDETLVVVDDLGGEEGGRLARRGGDYFVRLKREVTRTLLKLGPAAAAPAKLLLMGRAARDAEFVQDLRRSLELDVEVARPYDRVVHDLAADELEEANAEGVAALGVALRMVGDTGGSRVEFRQEEVRYARRFDQVKVALACASIAALLCVAILCLERLQRFKTLNHELINATSAVLSEYSQHAESEVLFQKVQSEELRPVQATQQARHELTVLADELREQLGRSTSIPRLASGLDYLNAVVVAIDKGIDKIGRIQMTSIDLDIMKEKPTLKLNGIVNAPESVDALVRAIRACDAVVGVQEPPVSGTKDGRLQFTNLEIDLVVNYDPRAKSEAGK
jgi:Tfp pilus assembly PilM family ATPase